MSEQKPHVVYQGILECGVCVPADWTDEQVISFVNEMIPSVMYWQIRRDDSERVPCFLRTNFVHVILDA